MLLNRKVVLEKPSTPLMVLEEYKINLSNLSLNEAYEELMNLALKNNSRVWGYFHSINADDSQYKSSRNLSDQLRSEIINKLDRSLRLAFIRISLGKQESAEGSLHLDSHEDARPIKDPGKPHGEEVLRVLINAGKTPRKLVFSDLSEEELKSFGATIADLGYLRINLPPDFKTKSIDLPPMTKESIWILKFWASLVPHKGVDDDNGHFLIAYGRYADINTYRL